MSAYYHQFLNHIAVPQEWSLHTDSFSLDCISGKPRLLFFSYLESLTESAPGPTAMLTLVSVLSVLCVPVDGYPWLSYMRELKLGDVSLSSRLKTSEHCRTSQEKCVGKTVRAAGRKSRSKI